MTWLTWRQYRIQLLIGAAILAVLAVLLLVTGLQVASQYHSALAACTANTAARTWRARCSSAATRSASWSS
jgi:hypothetical protein